MTAHAAVVSIPPLKDNSIFNESGALSNGAGSYIFAGENNEGALRRSLIAFDVAGAVPAGSTINSATLTLFVSRTRTGDTPVSLHRLLAEWGEAGSNADQQEGAGAPAQTGDATWTHRFYSTLAWSSAGGAFDPTPSATAIVGNQNNFYSWSSGAMTADVQAWLDNPAASYGWIVVGNEAGLKVAKRFDSRENPNTSTRPVLTIDFTAASTTGACCGGDGACTVVLDPGTGCAGTYQGAGVACDPNPCPQPTGACCLPDAAASCLDVTETECTNQGGSFTGELTNCAAVECPVVLERFVDPLPLPSAAQPVSGVAGGAATYDLAIREVSQQLHRDLPATRVWGFGDGPTGATYPGPTIEATSGTPVTVNWINDLRDSGGTLRTDHFLPVDTCPHGADDASPRTVVHLHGGHVPQGADGYPEATFLPGEQASYEYPNLQLPATLWYHDHALGITRLNVYMGMAGLYVLRDPVETALGLPAGEFEAPLVLQDRTFRPDGSLVYPIAWQEHFFGDTAVVNGKVWPYLQVKKGKYRFRLLNGSTSRTWELSLSSGASFTQIGTDGGLLPHPVTLSTITLSPGERADVIVDFAGYATGEEIFLHNSAAAPYPNGDPHAPAIADVVKFVVLATAGHTAAVADPLRPMEVLQEADAVVERDVELRKGSDPCSDSVWLINGLRWHDITEYPELGTTEVWRFINRSGVTHPMHMHLVMFHVLDRQLFEGSSGTIVPIGSPAPPAPEEAGWKDTVKVGPNEIVRVIARFENYKGKYPYHCHILEHEDHEMMRQFQTVSCGDGEVDPGEACDDGDLAGGDGCSPACTVEACHACTGSPSACTPADGIACDDALYCNGADTCGGGTCSVHTGSPCVGADGDPDCSESCDEATDVCTKNDPDGSACDDGLYCNGADTCSAGACALHAGNPCPGADADPDCSESCNEATDSCTGNDPDGSPCNDGSYCNGADTCSAGSCSVHAGDPCLDGVECANVCNEAAGTCDATAGTGCSDDGNPCTDDACNGLGACDHANDDTNPCDDGQYCTVLDACSAGVCTGELRDCSEGGDQCRIGTCNETSDACEGPPKADGTECNDYDECTAPDTCLAGECVGDPDTAACLDHFSCYKSRTTAGFSAMSGISLVDAFWASTVEAKKPKWLCTPANTNDGDPTAPGHPDHLESYLIRPTDKFAGASEVQLLDELGTTTVSLVKPANLLVPTAKSLTSPPAVPLEATVNHFECYKAKVSATTAALPVLSVPVEDQFGAQTAELRKLRYVCGPVNMNDDEPGAETGTGYLACYQQKSLPKFAKRTPVYTSNRFGSETMDVIKPYLLCMPATRLP